MILPLLHHGILVVAKAKLLRNGDKSNLLLGGSYVLFSYFAWFILLMVMVCSHFLSWNEQEFPYTAKSKAEVQAEGLIRFLLLLGQRKPGEQDLNTDAYLRQCFCNGHRQFRSLLLPATMWAILSTYPLPSHLLIRDQCHKVNVSRIPRCQVHLHCSEEIRPRGLKVASCGRHVLVKSH